MWWAGRLGSHCIAVLKVRGGARGLPGRCLFLAHFLCVSPPLLVPPVPAPCFCLSLSAPTSPSACPFPRPTAAPGSPLPRSEYKAHFSPRNLHAFSVEPLLVYPTHYTGDDGYVSDTETSVVWNNEHVKTDWDRAKSQKMREQQALSREAKNSDVLQSPLDSAARDEL